MLTAYLFDQRRGKEIEDWAGGVRELRKNQLLWVDLPDPRTTRSARSGRRSTWRDAEFAARASGREFEQAEGTSASPRSLSPTTRATRPAKPS